MSRFVIPFLVLLVGECLEAHTPETWTCVNIPEMARALGTRLRQPQQPVPKIYPPGLKPRSERALPSDFHRVSFAAWNTVTPESNAAAESIKVKFPHIEFQARET